jgi:transcriptional regulator of aroF, aroG, tyrA and aromatic amino acid transport
MIEKNIKINTTNKPGVTFETLKIFNQFDIDILFLEVLTEVIFVKFSLQDQTELTNLYNRLQSQSFTKSVTEINHFPSEIQTKQLKELFSKFEEAIVITDSKYKILFENDAFQKWNSQENKTLTQIFGQLPHLHAKNDFNSEELIELTHKKNTILNVSITSFISTISDDMNYIWIVYGNEEVQKKFIKPHYQTVNKLDDIIFKSNQMKQLIEIAKTISKTDVTVLIRGESGTGKELFARGIHQHSHRRSKPFITVNCSAIPDALLESELFGYEGGTFTGSLKDGKKGLFEQANTGTILLDEIGDMPFHLQSKLLRAIESKQIRRLGSEKEIDLDVRIIAATHQPLEEMIDNRLFRLDLFYRLNVHNIQIPPLRFRIEDIENLAYYFLEKFNTLFEKECFLSRDALTHLKNYHWPGNVRELENTIERSVFLSWENNISKNDLKINPRKFITEKKIDSIEGRSYKDLFNEFEKNVFSHPIFQNKTTREIANELGLSHTSVANKLRKFR